MQRKSQSLPAGADHPVKKLLPGRKRSHCLSGQTFQKSICGIFFTIKEYHDVAHFFFAKRHEHHHYNTRPREEIVTKTCRIRQKKITWFPLVEPLRAKSHLKPSVEIFPGFLITSSCHVHEIYIREFVRQRQWPKIREVFYLLLVESLALTKLMS